MEPPGPILDQLRKMIADDLDVDLSEDEIDEKASFFEDGLGIDSVTIIELISLIEDKFEIQFEDEDLVPENFGNLQILSKLVSSKVLA